jgi:hypothetical protein
MRQYFGGVIAERNILFLLCIFGMTLSIYASYGSCWLDQSPQSQRNYTLKKGYGKVLSSC